MRETDLPWENTWSEKREGPGTHLATVLFPPFFPSQIIYRGNIYLLPLLVPLLPYYTHNLILLFLLYENYLELGPKIASCQNHWLFHFLFSIASLKYEIFPITTILIMLYHILILFSASFSVSFTVFSSPFIT